MLDQCPICKSKVMNGIEICRRCGAELLIFNKIYIEATRLRNEGKFLEASALLPDDH